jgi:hypothetical protein
MLLAQELGLERRTSPHAMIHKRRRKKARTQLRLMASKNVKDPKSSATRNVDDPYNAMRSSSQEGVTPRYDKSTQPSSIERDHIAIRTSSV